MNFHTFSESVRELFEYVPLSLTIRARLSLFHTCRKDRDFLLLTYVKQALQNKVWGKH